jgi:hypothetical protein
MVLPEACGQYRLASLTGSERKMGGHGVSEECVDDAETRKA